VSNALILCRVVVQMSDGSRGVHTGMYPDLEAAVDRAMALFPEAPVIACAAQFKPRLPLTRRQRWMRKVRNALGMVVRYLMGPRP
jgi:hypothetical protein